jgi:hypothetical protein
MQNVLSSHEIKVVAAAFELAAKQIDEFAQRCIAATPKDSPVRFMCDETGRIDIAFLDVEIVATPRLVTNSSRGFLPEWTFIGTNSFTSCSIWKFYLDQNNFMIDELPRLNTPHSLNHDENNFHIKNDVFAHIVGKVMARLLGSELYAPASPILL